MDTLVTVLVLAGAVALVLVLVLTFALASLRRRTRTLREGRWPAQSCAVCATAISAPDQAIGVYARAIPGVIAGLPDTVRRTAEEEPTRFLLTHRSCADANSIDASDRVAVGSDLAHATIGEQTGPSCRHVFTPDGMAILRPEDPATEQDRFSVLRPACGGTWLAGWRIA